MVMAADNIDGSWLTTLLIVAGTALSLWSLRRARMVSKQRRRNSAAQLEEIQNTSAARTTADGIMVDLEAFARQMSAQLDTKCARLEALLDAADERLEALRNATSDAPVATAPPAPEITVEAPEPESQPSVDVLVSDEVEKASDEVEVEAPVATTDAIEQRPATKLAEASTDEPAANEPPAATSSTNKSPTDEAVPNDERAAIYELADLGHSPLRIAQSLNRPVGEVELILQLRSFA